MFNSQRPSADDLPTTNQLLRASAFAFVAAGAILVTVVLPAEYAIDPTGIGEALGFTQMGEIKEQLAQEAAADALLAEATVAPASSAPAADVEPATVGSRSDVTELTLAPGQAAEIKASMAKDASMAFEWSTAGGAVNFDTHADAPGIDYHGYGKGRNSTGEEGTLVAAFDGKHGWYWRNRSASTVTITLRTDGAYSDISKVL
ncbi:transmembrane anchor protein [Croceicoccus sp. Ery15]|uniref:transmembrane anchor protein n=1 Tax=Croceicoccus sp. Ery15 TaxID=1703338 RepID=UPI001E654C09|nr:transmembrane anchor protein [Croceicoccus sp. Ery15]